MEPLQKRKYDREQRRKLQIEQDLAPERMLQEEMQAVKRLVQCKEPIIERIKAYAQVENEEQDFQIIVNFNDCQVKPFKNQKERLEPCELGMMLYGRNLAAQDGSLHPVVKEAMKCSRTHLTEKKNMRQRESVTEQEIEDLEN